MLFITQDGELMEGTPVTAAESKLIDDIAELIGDNTYNVNTDERNRSALTIIQKYNLTLKTAKKPTTTRKK